jgi:signal transduction histidine kinase/predicted metal-dependent HD superfamily phosphohydrolase
VHLFVLTGMSDLNTDVQTTFEKLKTHKLVSAALAKLRSELAEDLYYHSSEHSVDVLHDAILYAIEDGLSNAELELIAIAAAFHDSGFIKGRKENEIWAAEFARSAMLGSGYSEEQISLVERMILDTRLVLTGAGPRQLVTHPLSSYLLDADMSNLGRSDFFEKGELYRRELGMPKDDFLRLALQIVKAHQWHTPAARRLRQTVKAENRKRLELLIGSQEDFEKHRLKDNSSSTEARQLFLSQLPLTLNASLDPQRVLERSLEELKVRLNCEAATIFLREMESNELSFWALSGGSDVKLKGLRIPDDKGIVGWVIAQRETVVVGDVRTDPRFFSEVDRHAGFVTRNMICAPLLVRGAECIGAVQVLNKVDGEAFTNQDVQFLSQVAQYIALAIDNARLFSKLRSRTAELEILDRRRSDVVQVIAHEFRTPLNVIQNCADLLVSGFLTDDNSKQQMQDALAGGVTRINRLIASVRDLRQAERADALKLSEVDVVKLLRQLQQSFAKKLAERQLQMEIHTDKPSHFVRADYAFLTVALRNLISNAIRFTPNGGSLGARCRSIPGACRIDVWDTGIGIAKEQHAVIFNKFFEIIPAQEHSSGDLEFRSSGLGIGLATTKAILERHQTSIEVASDIGKGATFTFQLPYYALKEEVRH